jgi:Lon protease-like protein
VEHLPNKIALFPLPSFVFFPDVSAPLHIFEPRYRDMIADVSVGDGIIGITMLRGDWERDYYGSPDLYEIGCAGRISTLARLPDGRYNLMLDGLSEFRVLRENREHAYRTAEVEWLPTPPESLELSAEQTDHLRDLLIRCVGGTAGDLWRSLVDERGLRGAALINFLCFHLDVFPIEKQTLLEARSGRGNCLIDVLTFEAEERKLGPGQNRRGSGPLQ